MLINQIRQAFNYHVESPVILVILAFILGILSTMITVKSKEISVNMRRSMIVLPPLVCSAILAINGSVGTSIAIAGLFSLVRFQSTERSSKDLTQAFFAMSIGLLCSTGGVFTAILLTFILSTIIVFAKKIIPDNKETYNLKLVVDEDAGFDENLNKVLTNYFNTAKLTKINSTEEGNLLELHYKVVPKESINKKEMIDEIKNMENNLKISYYRDISE